MSPRTSIRKKTYDNIFFSGTETDEYIDDGQHVVLIEPLIGEYAGDDIPQSGAEKRPKWFYRNVIDHCPIFATFDAEADTD